MPTLPQRSQTTQGLYGYLDEEGTSLGTAHWDGSFLSLPSLHRSETVALDWRETQLCAKPQLKWFDSLNAWVPVNKSTQRHPYMHFINSAPRTERYLTGKEGMQGPLGQGPEDSSRSLTRKPSLSYPQSSNTSQDSSSRKSRTVRFEVLHACQQASLQPPVEERSQASDVPQADWESEATLDAQSVELGHALEDQQEARELVEQPSVYVDEALEAVVVNNAVTLCDETQGQEEEEGELLPVEAEEEATDGGRAETEERADHLVTSEDVTDSVPVDTSPSPRPVPDAVSPLPLDTADTDAEPTVTSPPAQPPALCHNSVPEDFTPPLVSLPPSARSPVPEVVEADKADLMDDVLSRLTTISAPSVQKAKPKAVKTKKEKTASSTGEKAQTTARSKAAEKPKVPKPLPHNPSRSNTTTRPSVKMAKPPTKPKSEPKEKKERAVAPKPAPKPRPVKEKKVKPKEEDESEDDGPEDKPIPLPISRPEDMIWTPEPEDDPPPLSPEPVVQLKLRPPVKKKEKLPPPPPRRRTPTPPATPPGVDRQARVSFRNPSDDEDKVEELEGPTEQALRHDIQVLPRVTPLPDYPGESGSTPRSQPGTRRSSLRSQLATPRGSLVPAGKSRWGEKRRDRSLREQQERERLAEERRKRHAQMVERHKNKKGGDADGGGTDGAGLEDDGFLSKYCILNTSTTEQYRYAFEQMDEEGKGYLTEEEAVYGLRAINPGLSTSERTYLFRVMTLAGHQMKRGTDFRLFSILAALSQRVSRLDDWARTMMAQMDYKNLERKTFLCKTLWECNVDEDVGSISLEQLIVELRAGGVSPKHEAEVRDKLGALRRLDFLDFLLYVPLFVFIHQTVVTDPLTPSRAL